MQNFHSHTYRCHHAKGKDIDYVEAAIEAGYSEIGFSDHVPYPFPNNHYSTFRMELSETEGYVQSIRELQEKYNSKIKIHLGFEAEYYPKIFNDLLDFIKPFDYDYLILGQHCIGNEYDEGSFYCSRPTDNTAVLDRYISQTLEGISTGEFSYFAHPDLINYIGPRKTYKQKKKEYLKELHKLNIPLECNFLGFWDNRHYPNPLFWQLAAEEGNPVIIGLDAHQPEVYLDKKRLDKMKKFLNDLGIKPIDNFEIRK